ncbi:MAG TPA: hypothetical protein VMM35_04225 [Longimicrobiales bacterium]|nr:hypothetical protein [Longimicrobiales bacterium]
MTARCDGRDGGDRGPIRALETAAVLASPVPAMRATRVDRIEVLESE